MKFNIFNNFHSLKTGFVLLALSISPISSSFLASETNTEELLKNTNSHTGFKEYVAEAHGHMTPGEGYCPNPSQCRTLNEQLYIGFLRSKAIQNLLSLDKIYIAAVQPRADINGVTKVLMSAPTMLGVGSTDVKGAPLFRICIPTDRSKKSYADYHCPMMDCPLTLEEANACSDDPSVPLETPLKK